MKRILYAVLALAAFAACQSKQVENEPEYIVQVSLGGWHHPDYTAEQIIGRIDTVSNMIPVGKVIIGWSLDKTGGYTVPMLIFSSLGALALILGFWLKVEDKKKGYGLELPNIK